MVAAVERVSLDQCLEWSVGPSRIHHATGRYFSILCLEQDGGETLLIDQPEIGIRGSTVEGPLHSSRPSFLVTGC